MNKASQRRRFVQNPRWKVLLATSPTVQLWKENQTSPEAVNAALVIETGGYNYKY